MSLFRNHPNVEVTLFDLLNYINAGISHQKTVIKQVFQQTVRVTAGYSKLVTYKLTVYK